MGCNTSITNDFITRITNEQLNEIENDTISPLSFHFFLKNFYFISRYAKFYIQLPLKKQTLILETLSQLSKNFVKIHKMRRKFFNLYIKYHLK